jgi:hypothetical protein
MAVKLNLSPNVTTIMTSHGNIRCYLLRLKVIGRPECQCIHGIQTVDHLIFQRKRLKNEREVPKNSILKVGNWPVSKSELTNRNLIQFIRYINSMDIEKINHSNEQMRMKTNNRNVRLQQHVILLTVMEHAEDLIKKSQIACYFGKTKFPCVT